MIYRVLMHHPTYGDITWWVVGLVIVLLIGGGVALWLASRKFKAERD